MELQEQFRTICDGFILNGYSNELTHIWDIGY